MRMTDEEIRSTVGRMRMIATLKDELADKAIAGDPGARLVVFQAFKRFKAHTHSATQPPEATCAACRQEDAR